MGIFIVASIRKVFDCSSLSNSSGSTTIYPIEKFRATRSYLMIHDYWLLNSIICKPMIFEVWQTFSSITWYKMLATMFLMWQKIYLNIKILACHIIYNFFELLHDYSMLHDYWKWKIWDATCLFNATWLFDSEE